MKVILKETGEVVNVEHQNLGDRGSDIAFYCTELKRTISRGEFILEEKSIDWEQRRYEIAKEAMPFYSYLENEWTIKECVELAIEYADELINQLRNPN